MESPGKHRITPPEFGPGYEQPYDRWAVDPDNPWAVPEVEIKPTHKAERYRLFWKVCEACGESWPCTQSERANGR